MFAKIYHMFTRAKNCYKTHKIHQTKTESFKKLFYYITKKWCLHNLVYNYYYINICCCLNFCSLKKKGEFFHVSLLGVKYFVTFD